MSDSHKKQVLYYKLSIFSIYDVACWDVSGLDTIILTRFFYRDPA